MPVLHEKVKLGNTALSISRLSLGTACLGGLYEAVDEDRFQMTVQQALELGSSYFDTAPIYGCGLSERRLGHILSRQPRDSFVLSSKVGRLVRAESSLRPDSQIDPMYDGVWHDAPDVKIVIDFSYDGALLSIEESLKRLGLDRIDIVYIHDTFTTPQFEAAMHGAYRALDRLRSEGVIGAVGVGVGLTEMLVRFADAGNFDCFLVPGRYTLLDQSGLAELLPVCADKDIAIVLGGVFNSGILTDPHGTAPQFNYQPAAQEWLVKAKKIDAVCQTYSVPIKAAALQFPLAHPAIASILSGATTPEEVAENVALLQVPIPSDFWNELRADGLLPHTAPTP